MMTVQKASDTVKFVYDALCNPDDVHARAGMGDIHAALAPALETWIEECGGKRDIRMVSAVGSVNYHLLTNDSDLDMKAVYMPSFADFYHSSYPKFDFVTDVFDCALTPAHHYIQYILKGSMNHFEVLYSPTTLADPDFAYIIKTLLQPMVDMNIVKTVYAAWFMGMKAHSDATKTVWKPKKAANALRILTFLIRYIDEGSFQFTVDGQLRNAILRLKNGDMDASEYGGLYDELFAAAKEMAFDVYEGPKNYRVADSIYRKDRTDTDEWKRMNRTLDDAMMDLVNTRR